jgi:hypothetical protein
MTRRAAAVSRVGALLAAALSSACLVLSLQPVYDDRSIAFDEALLGRWDNADDQTQIVIERGEWRSYRIAYTERGTTRTLNGNATSLGDAAGGVLFMDVTELRGVDPGPYLIPVHAIYRVSVRGDQLSAAPLDFDWFTRMAAEQRRGMPPLAIDDRRNVILTAPTAELRRWLARAPAPAFSAPMTFTRTRAQD